MFEFEKQGYQVYNIAGYLPKLYFVQNTPLSELCS
jgi:hypothetical protein